MTNLTDKNLKFLGVSLFSILILVVFQSDISRQVADNTAAVLASVLPPTVTSCLTDCVVPNVLGLSAYLAEQQVKAAGFQAVTIRYVTGTTGQSAGAVVIVSPPPGSRQDYRTTITLSVVQSSTGGTVNPTIDQFYVRYNKNSYPYWPEVYWKVSGPTTMDCKLFEGGTLLKQITSSERNTTTRTTGFRILANVTKTRTVTLSCVVGSQVVTKQVVVPADEPTTSRTDGTSDRNIPTLNYFNISPTNRPVSVPGTLSWSMQCGSVTTSECRCTLKGGGLNKAVGRSGQETITRTTSASVTYNLACVNLNGERRVHAVVIDVPSTSPAPIPTTNPEITIFTITPSTRWVNESAMLSWTTKNATFCQLRRGGNNGTWSVVATSSDRETNTEYTYIPPISTNPNYSQAATTTEDFLLYCRNDNNRANSADVTLTTRSGRPSVLPPSQPGTPLPPPTPPTNSGIFRGGAYLLSPNTDVYAKYDLTIPSAKEPKIRARLRGKIPTPSNVVTAQIEKDALSSILANPVSWLLSAVGSLIKTEDNIDVYADGHGDYFKAPTFHVPYWAGVKLTWQFPGNAMMDADGPVDFSPNTILNPDTNTLTRTLPNWCAYIKSVEKTCRTAYPNNDTARLNCEKSKIGLSPSVWMADSLDTTTNTWKGFVNQLHSFDLKTCEKQFPAGQKDLILTPERPTRVVGIFSTLWTPPRADSKVDPHWPWQTGSPTRASGSQRFVKLQGYKCEKSFEDIIDSLNDGRITDITEDNFRKWSETDNFDHFGYNYNGDAPVNCSNNDRYNPAKCNSGDRQDLEAVITTSQLRCSTVNGNEFGTKNLFELMRGYIDQKKAVKVNYLRVEKIDSKTYKSKGYSHAVIGLSVKAVSPDRYDIGTLDPNEPGLMSGIICQQKPLISLILTSDQKVTLKNSFICNHTDQYFIVREVTPPPSLTVPGRADVVGWLMDQSNFPSIPNFDVSDLGYIGVCAGWSDFVLRVAYFGNFIGECPRPSGS